MKTCPICGDVYSEKDFKVNYHLQYLPVEITTDACTGCNYAEYLIRHPDEIGKRDPKEKFYMKKRMEVVREWTLKNKLLTK